MKTPNIARNNATRGQQLLSLVSCVVSQVGCGVAAIGWKDPAHHRITSQQQPATATKSITVHFVRRISESRVVVLEI